MIVLFYLSQFLKRPVWRKISTWNKLSLIQKYKLKRTSWDEIACWWLKDYPNILHVGVMRRLTPSRSKQVCHRKEFIRSYRCIRNGFQLFWFKFYSFHPIFVDESRESDFHHLLKAHGLWIRISAGRRKLYCSKTFIICLKIGEVVCMLNTRMRTKIDIRNVSCHQIMGFKVPVLHKKIQTKNRPLQSN